MFQLRDEHMQALGQVAGENFEQRAIAHFRKFFPSKTRDVSDDDLRARLHAASDRAKLYGLTTEQEVMRFADTGFACGEHFDRDPALPWAREILQNPAAPAAERASRLFQRAIQESKK